MSEVTEQELAIERVFDAPRALVFANWIDPERLGAWFAPEGFDVVECSVDGQPGGRWHVSYASSSGARYREYGEFIEVLAPERLRFTLVNEDAQGQIQFRTEVRISLSERDGKTTMLFSQRALMSRELRDAVERGWDSCFGKLDHQLAAEREIRTLYADWFRASARKDLDAAMAPIAPAVVAYEHGVPLAHYGADGVRASCKLGFDRMPDGLRWEVPELRVIIRSDFAITWGLNHMHGPGVDMWSRGTRVFQKRDGRWQMIHQHVSFPFDPSDGAAKLDLKP